MDGPGAAPSRFERYLAHLDELSGGVEPRFHPVPSTQDGLEGVVSIAYPDLPEPGLLTAVTYGLSLADHEDWRTGRRELCLAVRSADEVWAQAVAFLAEQLRGRAPFEHGDTVDFGERIAPGSAMDAFVVTHPAVLDLADAHVDVGDDLPVHIAGLLPVHRSEREFVLAHGFEAFARLEWDIYDVTRPPAV